MSKPIKLNFLKTGLLTLVVDDSRIGYQKYGVPVGGAMDSESASVANWLVGNKEKSPLLEINMAGPEIEFIDSCQIAITGANISPTINGKNIEMYQTQTIDKGSVLKFGKLVIACRAYIAICGKWEVKGWMDSKSPLIASNNASLNSIEITLSNNFIENRNSPKFNFDKGSSLIKVVKGPEFDWLDEKAKNILLKTTFHLLPASNRMGYRLTPSLPKIGSSMISSGVVPGKSVV